MESKFGTNVMTTNDFGDSIWYRIGCECGEGEHDVRLEFEIDPTYHMISVHFYKDLSYDSRFWFDTEDRLQIIKKAWNRIKACCRMLFTGRLTVSEEMIVMGEKHIDSIIDCFNEGKKYIVDIKKEPK